MKEWDRIEHGNHIQSLGLNSSSWNKWSWKRKLLCSNAGLYKGGLLRLLRWTTTMTNRNNTNPLPLD